MQNHLCFVMYEQHFELFLVKIELLSKTILHCVTPNNITHTLIGIIMQTHACLVNSARMNITS